MKSKAKRMGILFLTAIIFGAIIFFIFFRDSNSKKVEKPKVIKEIRDFGYVLRDNETKLYNDLFDKLLDELNKKEVDEEEYAKLVSELFVAGFYNLDNKITKTDIGGVQFVHKEAVENFKEKATDTIYKYVESNIYNDRNQELPIVDSIEVVNVEKDSFKYLKTTDANAYKVSLVWTYEKDLGYETECNLVLVHENNKLSVVEMD